MGDFRSAERDVDAVPQILVVQPIRNWLLSPCRDAPKYATVPGSPLLIVGRRDVETIMARARFGLGDPSAIGGGVDRSTHQWKYCCAAWTRIDTDSDSQDIAQIAVT